MEAVDNSNAGKGGAEDDFIKVPYLPLRIAAAREEAELTQEQMATHMGFTRQNFAHFETGQRRVKASELEKIAALTGKDVWFFLDPFRVVSGEARFSYRIEKADPGVLVDTEERLGRCVALWRHLSRAQRAPARFLKQSLELTVRSSYEDAAKAAEDMRKFLDLGDHPSERLLDAIENREGILVLHLDLPKGVSGAAARVPHGDTIVINRKEPATRRAFDCAHELFHLLTWETMPPAREDVSSPSGYDQKRIEQLANVFASSLLMPTEGVLAAWNNVNGADEPVERAAPRVAREFGVSCVALAWRLYTLREIDDEQRRAMSALTEPAGPPAKNFSKRFLELLAWGLDEGNVSERSALKTMGLTRQQLRDLFAEHEVPKPSDL